MSVLLNLLLTLDSLVSGVSRSVFPQLKLVYQLCLFPEMSDFAMVAHALVTSHLDYCNVLYMGLSLKMVWKLHLVQNAAAGLLLVLGFMIRVAPFITASLSACPVLGPAQIAIYDL